MATIKSYTDLEQSKKLAKILPLESADMRYGYVAPYDYSDRMYDGGYDKIPYPKDFLIKNPNFSSNEYDGEFPCWSLAALLSVVPEEVSLNSFKDGIWNAMVQQIGKIIYSDANDPVDACCKLIEKLHEQKLL